MSESDGRASLKQRVREYVEQTDYVSFAELGNHFGDEFRKGDRELSLGDNTVIWSSMTDAAVTAINELLEEKVIHAQPSSIFVYLCDGAVLNLPIVTSSRKYKKPHWLPVTLRPGSMDDNPKFKRLFRATAARKSRRAA